jgi:hypothetical protein
VAEMQCLIIDPTIEPAMHFHMMGSALLQGNISERVICLSFTAWTGWPETWMISEESSWASPKRCPRPVHQRESDFHRPGLADVESLAFAAWGCSGV